MIRRPMAALLVSWMVSWGRAFGARADEEWTPLF